MATAPTPASAPASTAAPAPTSNEPGQAVLAIFDTLIDRVKQARPVRSDGKPLGGGMVYSMMVLGMPVDPEDYLKPWSPMGGASLQDMASKGQLPNVGAAPAATGTAAATTAPAAAPAASTDPNAPPPVDPKYELAMQAAFKTAQLANVLLQVTTDGSYLEYPTGKHLDFAYEGIINSMQPMPMPPINPDVQKQIDAATAVLYDLDTDGSILGKSDLYKKYEKNAAAYAMAKATYAIAMAEAKTDPAKAEVWPMTSATYQNAVDDAYDTLKTEGAPKIEQALDVIASEGVCMQDHMIKKARQLFDAYNLGLAGVPAPIPWSYVSPTGWCDPDDDDDGWQQLTVKASDYQHYDTSKAAGSSQYSWMTKSSKDGGGGGVVFGFGAFGADASHSSSDSQWQGSHNYDRSSAFHNSAKNLNISLEYALCTFIRPWLVSDLFYMQNWYGVGVKKNAISDGTIANQVQTSNPLLPMIPQQFLVIRNVKISTSQWGSDGQSLANAYGGSQGSTDSQTTSVAAGGGFSLGFISFGGHGEHDDTTAKGQGSSWSGKSATNNFGTTFDGETLNIPGAQIIAFLSDIVPPAPPLDDPGLAQQASAAKTTTTPAAAPAATTTTTAQPQLVH
jgi:hypothetical protein